MSITFTTHGNAIGDANGVILPCQHALLLDSGLHRITKAQYCKMNT